MRNRLPFLVTSYLNIEEVLRPNCELIKACGTPRWNDGSVCTSTAISFWSGARKNSPCSIVPGANRPLKAIMRPDAWQLTKPIAYLADRTSVISSKPSDLRAISKLASNKQPGTHRFAGDAPAASDIETWIYATVTGTVPALARRERDPFGPYLDLTSDELDPLAW